MRAEVQLPLEETEADGRCERAAGRAGSEGNGALGRAAKPGGCERVWWGAAACLPACWALLPTSQQSICAPLTLRPWARACRLPPPPPLPPLLPQGV